MHSSAAYLGQEAWVTPIKHRGHFLEGIACGAWLHFRAAARSCASSRQRLAMKKWWLACHTRRSCPHGSRTCGKHSKTVPAASLATSPAPPPHHFLLASPLISHNHFVRDDMHNELPGVRGCHQRNAAEVREELRSRPASFGVQYEAVRTNVPSVLLRGPTAADPTQQLRQCTLGAKHIKAEASRRTISGGRTGYEYRTCS